MAAWGYSGHERNYGGRECEIACSGGEVQFIRRMIRESKKRPKLCIWFTSLVAREASLSLLEQCEERAEVPEFRVYKMQMGQNMKSVVCWSWMQPHERDIALRNLYVGTTLDIAWKIESTPSASSERSTGTSSRKRAIHEENTETANENCDNSNDNSNDNTTPKFLRATVLEVKKAKILLAFEDDGERRWTRLKDPHRWVDPCGN